MQGGDISNEVPPRIAVTEAVLIDDISALKTTRWMRRHVTAAVNALDINRAMLARCWQYSRRNGCSWELVVVGRPEAWGEPLLERINDEGMSGIARVLAYDNYQDFARDLAWRSYLIGVVDAAPRHLVYGGRYIDPGRIA